MTHLRIELNNIPENVTTGIISKLYQYAKEIKDYEEDPLNNVTTSLVSLKGNLSVPKAYGDEIDWLETEFPDLHITATLGRYMRFADSALVSRMLQYLGDGVGIINNEITNSNWYSNTTDPNTNNTLFINNTAIISFNELGDLTLITTIPNNVFKGCTNITSIDLSNCTSIGTEAFENCTSLTSVDLSSCTTIGSQAFYGCSALLNVSGLSNVTSLGENAFRECSRLLSLIDLSNCNNIGKQAFQDCSSLTSVLLSTNLTTIPLGCFLRCSNLTNIDLSNVEIINGNWLYGAFLDCTGLTSIDLSSCTSIGNSCFMRCTNLQVSNTQNVTSIGNACFYGCSSITELYMPNVSLTGPTSNNKNNFGNCTLLSKITLGDCVTLGDDFSSSSEWNIYFLNCTSLHTVDVKSLQTVPNNIGDAVFKNCPNMRNFIIRSTTVPTVQNNGSTLIKHFGGSSVKIYVPDAAVNDYKNATGWSNVSDYIYPLSDYQP